MNEERKKVNGVKTKTKTKKIKQCTIKVLNLTTDLTSKAKRIRI